MSQVETINATQFKARCLELLDRLSERKLERLEVTKRGRVVAIITPPASPTDWVEALQNDMRGMTTIPEDWDLTAPVLDEELDADKGLLHR